MIFRIFNPLFFLFIIFLNNCTTVGIGEYNIGDEATGEPRIFIKDNFQLGKVRPLPGKIFFYQDADTFSSEDNFQTRIYLSAKGGTIDSGLASAYTWKFDILENDFSDYDASWLSLEIIGGLTVLTSVDEEGNLDDPPDETGFFDIQLEVTSNENNKASAEVRVVVLANHGTNSGSPWHSSGFSATEYEDGSGDMPSETNKNGKDRSNDCTSNPNLFEWLNRGETVRKSHLEETNSGTVDCYKIDIIEDKTEQTFFIEEIPFASFTAPDNIREICDGDPPYPARSYSFLMKIGRKLSDTYCPSESDLDKYYSLHVPDNPAGPEEVKYLFPDVEKDSRAPFALVRDSESGHLEHYIQYARCDNSYQYCHCDQPGKLNPVCARLEKLPGTIQKWKLSFTFDSDSAIRKTTSPYDYFDVTDSLNAGPGKYYLIVKNESSDSLLQSVMNYKISWPLNDN